MIAKSTRLLDVTFLRTSTVMLSAQKEFELAKRHMTMIDLVDELRNQMNEGGLGTSTMKSVEVGELDPTTIEQQGLASTLEKAHAFVGIKIVVSDDEYVLSSGWMDLLKDKDRCEETLRDIPEIFTSVYRAAILILALRLELRRVLMELDVKKHDWSTIESIINASYEYERSGIELPCKREIRRTKTEVDNKRLVEDLEDAMQAGAAQGSVGDIDPSLMDESRLLEVLRNAEDLKSKSQEAMR